MLTKGGSMEFLLNVDALASGNLALPLIFFNLLW